MPTIALDLFFMVSSTSEAMTHLISSFHHIVALILEMEWQATFRDLQSSHETLNGLDSRCLLRLPEVSAPSLSEASSSPLHASSSACSASLAGELSASLWFIVGAGSGAGEKEPSWRMARSYSKQLPRHNTPSSDRTPSTTEAPAASGRDSTPPNNGALASLGLW